MTTTSEHRPGQDTRSAESWVQALVYTAARRRATEQLLLMGPAGTAALEKGLLDSNNRVREEAAAVLATIWPTLQSS